LDLHLRRARRRERGGADRRRASPCRRRRRHPAVARTARNPQARAGRPCAPRRLRGGSMSASLARVPCTIVTGFLGAGKTTLIRHVLANAQGRRLAVIVNEFGDVGIDGELLKGCGDAACPEENIVELANGCLCCTVADEFVPALDVILSRTPKVDHI